MPDDDDQFRFEYRERTAIVRLSNGRKVEVDFSDNRIVVKGEPDSEFYSELPCGKSVMVIKVK